MFIRDIDAWIIFMFLAVFIVVTPIVYLANKEYKKTNLIYEKIINANPNFHPELTKEEKMHLLHYSNNNCSKYYRTI